MTATQTPEAKLLNLIRKKPGVKTGQRRMWPFVDWLKMKSKQPWSISPVQAANRLMVGLIIFELLFLIGDRVRRNRPYPGSPAAQNNSVQARNDEAVLFDNEEAPNGVSLAALTRRNVFAPLIAPEPPKPKVEVQLVPPPPPPPRIPLSHRAAHLRLVGILGGNPPEAMVEDSRARRVLTIKPGDTIGELQVEKILSDKIILLFEDERMDLSL